MAEKKNNYKYKMVTQDGKTKQVRVGKTKDEKDSERIYEETKTANRKTFDKEQPGSNTHEFILPSGKAIELPTQVYQAFTNIIAGKNELDKETVSMFLDDMDEFGVKETLDDVWKWLETYKPEYLDTSYGNTHTRTKEEKAAGVKNKAVAKEVRDSGIEHMGVPDNKPEATGTEGRDLSENIPESRAQKMSDVSSADTPISEDLRGQISDLEEQIRFVKQQINEVSPDEKGAWVNQKLALDKELSDLLKQAGITGAGSQHANAGENLKAQLALHDKNQAEIDQAVDNMTSEQVHYPERINDPEDYRDAAFDYENAKYKAIDEREKRKAAKKIIDDLKDQYRLDKLGASYETGVEGELPYDSSNPLITMLVEPKKTNQLKGNLREDYKDELSKLREEYLSDYGNGLYDRLKDAGVLNELVKHLSDKYATDKGFGPVLEQYVTNKEKFNPEELDDNSRNILMKYATDDLLGYKARKDKAEQIAKMTAMREAKKNKSDVPTTEQEDPVTKNMTDEERQIYNENNKGASVEIGSLADEDIDRPDESTEQTPFQKAYYGELPDWETRESKLLSNQSKLGHKENRIGLKNAKLYENIVDRINDGTTVKLSPEERELGVMIQQLAAKDPKKLKPYEKYISTLFNYDKQLRKAHNDYDESNRSVHDLEEVMRKNKGDWEKFNQYSKSGLTPKAIVDMIDKIRTEIDKKNDFNEVSTIDRSGNYQMSPEMQNKLNDLHRMLTNMTIRQGRDSQIMPLSDGSYGIRSTGEGSPYNIIVKNFGDGKYKAFLAQSRFADDEGRKAIEKDDSLSDAEKFERLYSPMEQGYLGGVGLDKDYTFNIDPKAEPQEIMDTLRSRFGNDFGGTNSAQSMMEWLVPRNMRREAKAAEADAHKKFIMSANNWQDLFKKVGIEKLNDDTRLSAVYREGVANNLYFDNKTGKFYDSEETAKAAGVKPKDLWSPKKMQKYLDSKRKLGMVSQKLKMLGDDNTQVKTTAEGTTTTKVLPEQNKWLQKGKYGEALHSVQETKNGPKETKQQLRQNFGTGPGSMFNHNESMINGAAKELMVNPEVIRGWIRRGNNITEFRKRLSQIPGNADLYLDWFDNVVLPDVEKRVRSGAVIDADDITKNDSKVLKKTPKVLPENDPYINDEIGADGYRLPKNLEKIFGNVNLE
ncbi:MAG: hypothetical protein J6Y02_03880 [Pseudobutyrivibrio sp.]|nr:hypothetical protein [Pseudobutyrivibrio sp.]